MIIKTEKHALLDGLQSVIGVIGSKNTLPILSNILIQTKDDHLELIGTDLDIGIISKIQTENIEDGAITLPAKKFFDIVKELPESKLTITAKKNHMINIECLNTYFKIMGIPKEEFPKLPQLIDKNKVILPQALLKEMLMMTFFAVSHDETRYILNGILFVLEDNRITLVATDGRRLAIIKKEITLPKNTHIKAVLPSKTIQEVNRALSNEGEAIICFDGNQAMFAINNSVIVSRLIEGEFPNYEQAIPKQNKNKLTVDREKFLSAIKRASLLTTQDSQAVKIDIAKDRVVVSKQTPNLGEAKEEIECKHGGEPFFIGFNPTYLLDGLKNIKQPELNIELSGPEKPAVVKVGDDYLYVVLPMQIA